ncbi:MAG: D-aminoacyl-tRNA deacylase [Proteobacteria bacterium]|nr:D-aminoacyl-tRNA deacylase [Pseudomonadota bacterium]
MLTLIQRVTEAQVRVDDQIIGAIGPGIVALVGITPEDTPAEAERLLQRILGYRIFADDQGRMNLDLRQRGGGLLLVPQFTLAADTRKGLRPGFSTAAAPAVAQPLFDSLVERARALHPQVACGRFGANMQVALINDGPVTFLLHSGEANK